MTNQDLVLLCTVGGTVGGAVGAAIGFWVTTKVTIAVQGAKIKELGEWVRSLRRSRHSHRNVLQKHELRIGKVEIYTGLRNGN